MEFKKLMALIAALGLVGAVNAAGDVEARHKIIDEAFSKGIASAVENHRSDFDSYADEYAEADKDAKAKMRKDESFGLLSNHMYGQRKTAQKASSRNWKIGAGVAGLAAAAGLGGLAYDYYKREEEDRENALVSRLKRIVAEYPGTTAAAFAGILLSVAGGVGYSKGWFSRSPQLTDDQRSYMKDKLAPEIRNFSRSDYADRFVAPDFVGYSTSDNSDKAVAERAKKNGYDAMMKKLVEEATARIEARKKAEAAS